MRILICGSTYWPSKNGQAIFTVNLAERLAGRGHQVTVLYPSENKQPYQTTRNGVLLEHARSYQLFPRIHPHVWVPTPSRKDIVRVFDDSQPEVLHFQDHYPPTTAMIGEARKRGVHIIGTNHYMPENIAPYVPALSKIKPLFKWIGWKWMLWSYNRAQVVTAQSKAAADLVRAQGLKPPVYPVSCGIDLKRFHPDPSVDRLACRKRYALDPARKIFLFVGRVDAEKRVDVLLRAMKRLTRDDVQLVVAGQGAAARDLHSLAKNLHLGDKVRFTGFIPNEDLHILLNSVDVFTMPSEAELLSIASLEAMACGKPVLLANAVALPELATQGENGYLFKPGDAADAARCMDMLADHPERWPAMGQASLKRAQEHGLEKTITRYEELYKKPEL